MELTNGLDMALKFLQTPERYSSSLQNADAVCLEQVANLEEQILAESCVWSQRSLTALRI